jgi:hypothetical protein
MHTKTFHLGDLLSITDGKLVSPRHIGGVYDVIDFVTGVQHLTHQLIRAAGPVKEWLLKQHPWLADIEVPAGLGSEGKVLIWLAGATEKWGANHEVEAMPPGMYVGREPIAELCEMAPHMGIIAVQLPPEERRDEAIVRSATGPSSRLGETG